MYVKNLSDYYVSSAKEVYEIMRQGGQTRIVSSTSAFLSILIVLLPTLGLTVLLQT